MAFLTERDIQSIPQILRQTAVRIKEQGTALAPLLQGSIAFLGCGSSHCISLSAAALYEARHHRPAQGIMGSEYLVRPGWNHVVISRTGQTTELVEAMSRIHRAGLPVALIRGEADSPAEQFADVILPLEFAPERGIIQTRFILASLYALRLLIGGDELATKLADLPEQIERGLTSFDFASLGHYQRVVFLGRGWRYGIANMAALNQQETALLAPESHQTLEYRHGPIATANEQTLIWCFDPPSDSVSAAVLDDVRATGATVYCSEDDPLVSAAQAFLLAMHLAAQLEVNPDAPRNLSRAILLSIERVP